MVLTANTSTVYVLSDIDLKCDGPIAVEALEGMLGAFNDARFQYIEDIGPSVV